MTPYYYDIFADSTSFSFKGLGLMIHPDTVFQPVSLMIILGFRRLVTELRRWREGKVLAPHFVYGLTVKTLPPD